MFAAALGQHARAYQIVKQPIPLTDPAAVAAALSVQKVDADLVAIVRGGGEGISALSDRQVIDAVAHHVPVPIVSAVGHEVDRPLVQDWCIGLLRLQPHSVLGSQPER